MRGNYVVIMNNIVVPNVIEIESKKNMINMNPRGVLDIHLDGKEFMPGTLIIRTKTNVEDFFRLNTPLIVAKRLTTKSEIAEALQSVAHMLERDYNEPFAAQKLIATISAGYLPVFQGVCASFNTSWVNSADYVGYEYIIGGFDLSIFLTQPYQNTITAEEIFEKVPDRYKSVTKSAGVESKKMVGRQAFVCTGVTEFLKKSEQYQGFREEVFKPVQDVLTPLVSGGASVLNIAEVIGLKQSCLLKVPINNFEEHQEAISFEAAQWAYKYGRSPENEDNMRKPDEPVIVREPLNMNWAYTLGNICPRAFYETFFREDLGEFVFRRSGWLNLPGGLPRQSYQNPRIQIIAPTNSMTVHQKLWGGKMGDVPLTGVYGSSAMVMGDFAVSSDLGQRNKRKFGTKSKGENTFNNIDSIGETGLKQLENPNNVMQFTDVFCASNYFQTSDFLDTMTLTGAIPGARESSTSKNLQKMLSWMSKYHYTYPYVMWVGFSTYFMIPLGAAMQIIARPSPASLAGAGFLLGAGLDRFVSVEAASSYRVIGKIFRVAFREDGSYSEEYYQLLGCAAPGFKQNE